MHHCIPGRSADHPPESPVQTAYSARLWNTWLYIFWPGGDVDDYGPEDVTNCSFGRHLEARGDARTYDIVRGGQAFYHKIVTDLREWNISADMWEGFKLETVTELPK